MKYGIHFWNRNGTGGGKVTEECVAKNNVRLTEVHRTDVDYGGIVANSCINFQNGVMNSIDSHATKCQRISRRAVVSIGWVGGANKIVGSQNPFLVGSFFNGTQKCVEVCLVHGY